MKVWECLFAAALGFLPGDGFEFLRNGKPGYARTAFRNQLKRTPNDDELRYGLGLSELALGNPTAALENLLAVLDRKSQDAAFRRSLAEAFYLAARNRIATGRDDEHARFLLMDARQQAQEAARLDARSASTFEMIARTSIELREPDRAKSALEEAARLGLHETRCGEIEGAIAYLNMLERIENGAEDAEGGARQAIEELLQRNPQSADLWVRLGDLHYNGGQFDTAFDCYGKSLEIDALQRPLLENLLGDLAEPEFRDRVRALLDQALEVARKQAPDHDPRVGFPYYAAAQARIAQRQYREAIPLLMKALEAEGALEIPCQLAIGDAQFRENQHAASCTAYLRALRKDFDESMAQVRHLSRADLVAPCLIFHSNECYQGKRLDDARELLAAAVDLAPDDKSTLNNYAFVCRESGKYEESYRAYSRLLGLAPDTPRYLNDCALILHYHLRRDLNKAESMYRRAIENADRLIAASDTPPDVRDAARLALADARANLDKLTKSPK